MKLKWIIIMTKLSHKGFSESEITHSLIGIGMKLHVQNVQVHNSYVMIM